MNVKIPWKFRKPFIDQSPDVTGTKVETISGQKVKVVRYDMDAGTRAWLDRREKDLPQDEADQ